MNVISKVYAQAKAEGRLCSRCGWIIPKRYWKKGNKMCKGCQDGLKGVNVRDGWGKYREEPVDKTGEMP